MSKLADIIIDKAHVEHGENRFKVLLDDEDHRGDEEQDCYKLLEPSKYLWLPSCYITEKEKAASVGERFMRRDYPYVSNASGLGESRVDVLSRRLTALAARRGSLPDQCCAESPLEECVSSTDTRSDWHATNVGLNFVSDDAH